MAASATVIVFIGLFISLLFL
jgi:hypothetical protein